MRPFFSYYGAKWNVARHLGPPRHGTVVEPFAGSACYSTYWCAPDVRLYDVSPDIVALWDWLIHSSDADVARLPDRFDDMDDIMSLPIGPQMLVRFWVARAREAAPKKMSPWYYKQRDDASCNVWGAPAKARIRSQKPHITGWRVQQASYVDIPNIKAHWHVDPPYSGAPGRKYAYSDIAFVDLAEWCKQRDGHVDVCENDGATWLPFKPLCNVVSSRGRSQTTHSREAVWSIGCDR